MSSGGQNNSTSTTMDQKSSHARGDHSADQVSQTDKPIGPFPKSSSASVTKKDGGV